VEDDPNDVEIFARAIKDHRLTIDAVESTSEALRQLEQYDRYLFAFVDLTLHGVNATPLIASIKQRYPWIGIIVITGTTDLNVRKVDELIDAGANRIFAKNFTSSQMRELMNAADTNKANFERGKPKRSWKTTACGVVGATLAGYSFHFNNPDILPFAVASIALGMTFAADSSIMKQLLEVIIASRKKES
jgi:DNA-binding NtrC family response regulator